VGTNASDDAAVYRLSSELAIIQTVDFFTPVVDDPYLFGAIAAANSLSDVYAMGGTPTMALNIVGFPAKGGQLPMSVLGDILRGGADKAAEAGIPIVGGHSIDDQEPKYGLSVTGTVHPDRYWTNIGAQPGDRLVLTKPIGVGIITTALRDDDVDPSIEQKAVESMQTLNRLPAEIASEVGIRACTDVSGFGLLGHLFEMLQGVGARLHFSTVPLLQGVSTLASRGFVPGGSQRNLESLNPYLKWDPQVSAVDRLILADAQTSGGLLFAVAPDKIQELMSRLREAGQGAAEIGEIISQHPQTISIMP
jgi:selenide, water dikinase